MKISYNWLQTYFKEKLLTPEKIGELFTFHASEVEGIETALGDTVLDLKILPDRAHYCLSHRGVAGELGVLTHQPVFTKETRTIDPVKVRDFKVDVKESQLCPRYTARVVENVSVGESPAWLKERLNVLGQRSINSIVDATNYIMLDLGQPLHAFDADKVEGNITVRKAKVGEKITTLDGKEITLGESMLVIADNVGPLAIAGVKGGMRAQVGPETKNLIIESANFNSSSVRKTSTAVGIRNDASKRFENGITPVWTEQAMIEISALIKELSPTARFGEIIDIYTSPVQQQIITIDPTFISAVLGVLIAEPEIVSILERLKIGVKKLDTKLVLTIPFERLDLVIPEDVVEEVGRIYGYEKITGILPPKLAGLPAVNKLFYYSEKIKNILVGEGFSEVYLYTLVDRGDYEIEHPLAADKNFLRTELTSGLSKSLEFNARNAPLLGVDEIKIFEIGKVFPKKGEHASVAVGIQTTKNIKKKDVYIQDAVTAIQQKLSDALGVKIEGEMAGGVFEFNLDELVVKLPDPLSYDDLDLGSGKAVTYKKISPYPFVGRDIAVFVPEGVNEDEVLKLIKKEGSELLVRIALFDVFKKTLPDGGVKNSYAFRLVFQSMERTLFDVEINTIMEKMTKSLNAESGWLVR